ncbi:MAG: hypothetical protein Q9P01_04045 [Anaerolineae bacterium]|nr:hypothetical protein [Anaerolineae bacterium]
MKVNSSESSLTGGELIELKSAKSYSVASFNSQIPKYQKKLDDLASNVLAGMRDNDKETDSLPIRDVYYLIRGYRETNMAITEPKICLVSGKFFETVAAKDLIQNAFEQVIDERQALKNLEITEDFKKTLVDLFSEQESFSKTRSVENASVSIRFRIMTQAVGAGNILSTSQYPKLGVNTLNLVLPYYSNQERDILQNHMRGVMKDAYEDLEQFELKHPYNGSFWVFQLDISQ